MNVPKVAALACHDSQRSWLKQHGMDDYIESMKRWSARRGYSHPTDDLLARLLGSSPAKAT